MQAAGKVLPDEGVTVTRAQLLDLGRSEWLLTNGMGGFAMGTARGVPERRYHAWLIAAMRPPLGRVATLHSCAEWLVVENGPEQSPGVRRYDLSAYQFGGGTIHPHGLDGFQEFRATPESVSWRWVVPGVNVLVTRSLLLAHGANGAAVQYTVVGCGRRAWIEVRPLMALRDFHELRSVGARFDTRVTGASVEVLGGGAPLMLAGKREDGGDGAQFVSDPQWWMTFEYARDRERGQESNEDLFSPGVFVFGCEAQTRVVVQAWTPTQAGRESPFADSWGEELRKLQRRTGGLVQKAGAQGGGETGTARGRAVAPALVKAADAFVVSRDAPGRALTSIIAGYPWFSDWGRDTFISMRGLLLCTGRFKEALEVLQAFAGLQRRGLIPNCFDDGSGAPQYNTVDASLWFVHAACEYQRVTGDRAGFATVRQACLNVIEAFRAGTDFGIRVDADGLVAAGNEGTQLTWMDAQRDGVVFTPRHGKPVEINALWYSGLLELAREIEPELPRRARELVQVADVAGRGFGAFWNDTEACLFDVLTPAPGGWSPNPQVRPNQVFAVSQPFSPLPPERQRAVVACVRERLLTPVGLRTLERADPAYVGRYEGPLRQRDGAYHNGTVWPWLIGPYGEAVLRVGQFSDSARAEVRAALTPLLDEFTRRREAGPLRQVAEIYDAEPIDGLQRPEGCMAQAWSVGEMLRVRTLAAG